MINKTDKVMSAPEIIAICVVGLFIVSCPILFNIFGKEDGCGWSLWDRWKASKNKK